MKKKKIEAKKIVIRRLSSKELGSLAKKAEEGNVPAYFELVLHNQKILNGKLNKIIAHINKQEK